jgi:hypothetical protein
LDGVSLACGDVHDGTAQQFMWGVGVVEIIAAGLVAFKPRVGGVVVAVWLWGIIANLLSIPGFYDIALRDFGLSLGALALSRLAVEFDHYRKVSSVRTADRSADRNAVSMP